MDPGTYRVHPGTSGSGTLGYIRVHPVAALSDHDLNGSSSYPVHLSIRNHGNLSYMGEKSKLATLTNNYQIKHPSQFKSSDGQDSTRFPSRFVSVPGVASSDWLE